MAETADSHHSPRHAVWTAMLLVLPMTLAALVVLVNLAAPGPRNAVTAADTLLALTVTVLLDGGLALMVLLAAVGWGAWPTRWLVAHRLDRGQQAAVSLALGLGVTGIITLALGSVGFLTAITAWATVAGGWLLGLVLVGQRGGATPAAADAPPAAVPRRQLLPLAIALLPLGLMMGYLLFGAALPPGVLWNAEGNGYDVLEYHLQAPREYFTAGEIHFLPHNVYAQFPQQVEIHYLLLMHLLQDPYPAALPAQFFHALLAIAFVLALCAWLPGLWARVVAAVLAGTAGYVTYTGVLAYVENGMLLFATVSAGLLLVALRSGCRRLLVTAGLCAGLAMGCKYTAGGLVIAPLVFAWLIVGRGAPRQRVIGVLLFGVAASVAVAPWLIRNAAFTGNPVYPFAYEWFGGAAWSIEQAAQWERGHQVPEEHASFTGRLTLAAQELFGSGMYGPTLFALGVAGLLARRDRASLLLSIWIVTTLLVWISVTHIPGRFAIVIVIPLALAAGRLTQLRPAVPPPLLRMVTLVIAVIGGLLNVQTIQGLLASERPGPDVSLAGLVGATHAFAAVGENAPEPVNRVTPPDSRIWFVGQANVFYVRRPMHYTVVFNRDPWLEFVKSEALGEPPKALNWLRRQNATHLVFSWAEIERLRATYGFSPMVTRDWVATLEASGLRRVYRDPGSGPARYEVYALPPTRGVMPSQAPGVE